MSNPEKKLNKNLKTILLAALFAALEFVVTYLISFPIPIIQGAYVNAGDTVLYLGACYIGGIWSALSAGIGSMLADIAWFRHLRYSNADHQRNHGAGLLLDLSQKE